MAYLAWSENTNLFAKYHQIFPKETELTAASSGITERNPLPAKSTQWLLVRGPCQEVHCLGVTPQTSLHFHREVPVFSKGHLCPSTTAELSQSTAGSCFPAWWWAWCLLCAVSTTSPPPEPQHILTLCLSNPDCPKVFEVLAIEFGFGVFPQAVTAQ